jgi:hypothetical protein
MGNGLPELPTPGFEQFKLLQLLYQIADCLRGA